MMTSALPISTPLAPRAPPLSPAQWGDTLSRPPVLSTDSALMRSGLLRRWTGTAPEIAQPPLDHHYLVLHLGGSKRVTRTGEGPSTVVEIKSGAISLIPAGLAFRWLTEGPIDYAHLYIDPRRLDRVVVDTFDREPRSVQLLDRVGLEDPLLRALMGKMLEEAAEPRAGSELYLDTLSNTVLVQLVREHSTLAGTASPARHALAPYRLRRVLEFIDAHLSEPVDLASLAEVAGLSRYHFSRAFQRATGTPPYAFLTARRIEAAKRLIRRSDLPLAEVATRSGFASAGQFSTAFRRVTGLSPSRYRHEG